jgi:hypothetical protein
MHTKVHVEFDTVAARIVSLSLCLSLSLCAGGVQSFAQSD